jgi:predicted MFS family arabinose efflux permease
MPLAANALLGVTQGLTWSTAVIMKIDLASSKSRGLASSVVARRGTETLQRA